MASAQSLDAALARAYMSNPTLNAQRAGTRANDETVSQALAGYRPTIGASGTVGAEYNAVKSGGFQSSQGYYPRGVGLEVNQTLFNGFRTANSVRAAEAGVLSQRATLDDVEQQVLLQAVQAYMNVYRDTALLNLEINNVQVLEEQLKQTNDRFDVGEVTRTDVEQAKSSLAGARAQMFSAQATLKGSIAIYRQIIGVDPGKRLTPARSFGKLMPRSLNRAIGEGLRVHPAIVAAQHAVDAAALQVNVAEGALYPTVSATGSVSQNWEPQSAGQRQFAASIGATLSVPIYTGGADYSRIRQAKETLGQFRIQADVSRQQVRASIVSAWSVYSASASVIQAQQAQVQSSEVALSGVREEAKVGQRTTLDILNAQQVVLSARAQLISAQRDRVVASYSLLQAVGKLNARSLGLRVSRYNPKVHYRQVRDKWVGTQIPDGR